MAAMPNHHAPTEEEVAAALAAVRLYLASPAVEAGEHRLGWRDSARLASQHVRPGRVSVRPSWRTVERLRRQLATGFLGGAGLF